MSEFQINYDLFLWVEPHVEDLEVTDMVVPPLGAQFFSNLILVTTNGQG